MEVRSEAFKNSNPLPQTYTCDGEEVSPPLTWEAPPENTRSFLVICEDPDSPKAPFYHWGVYDIPADQRSLRRDIPPRERVQEFRQARNDFGNIGYGGACPPPGDDPHRYHFSVWALSVESLEVRGTPTVEDLIRLASPHVLEKAEIQSWHQR